MSELKVRRDPPRPFLALAGVIRRDDIAERIGDLVVHCSKVSTGVPHLGRQIALYHPQGSDPFGPDGEPVWLGRELTAKSDAPPGLQLNWIPGGDVAVLVHEGPHEKMLETHFALHEMVESLGRKLVGPNWEIYVTMSDDPDQFRTEVCYLLESA